MSNTTAHFNDDGRITRVRYDGGHLRIGFSVRHENGDVVATIDDIITSEIEEGYDPTKGFVDVYELQDALVEVAELEVVDRVESLTEQRQREDTEQ